MVKRKEQNGHEQEVGVRDSRSCSGIWGSHPTDDYCDPEGNFAECSWDVAEPARNHLPTGTGEWNP